MSTSFVSERSVEYILIPQFVKLLYHKYSNVIPIYFWSSREGNNVAKECLTGLDVIVIALYCRRPKINVPKQNFIEVNFNENLFHRNRYFIQNGVSVFAGVPLVSSMADFNINVKSKWFCLNVNGVEEVVQIELETMGKISSNSVIELEEIDVLRKIQQDCAVLPWNQFVEVIEGVRRSQSFFIHSLFGDIYKPVYFIIPVS